MKDGETPDRRRSLDREDGGSEVADDTRIHPLRQIDNRTFDSPVAGNLKGRSLAPVSHRRSCNRVESRSSIRFVLLPSRTHAEFACRHRRANQKKKGTRVLEKLPPSSPAPPLLPSSSFVPKRGHTAPRQRDWGGSEGRGGAGRGRGGAWK